MDNWNDWLSNKFEGLEIKPSEELVSIKDKSKKSPELFFKIDHRFNLTEVSLISSEDIWNGFHIVMDQNEATLITIEQDNLFIDLSRVDYPFNEENVNKVLEFLKIVLQGWKEAITCYKDNEIDITFEFKNGLKCSKNIFPLEEFDIPLLGKSPYKLGNWFLRKFRSNKLKTKEFEIEGLSSLIRVWNKK